MWMKASDAPPPPSPRPYRPRQFLPRCKLRPPLLTPPSNFVGLDFDTRLSNLFHRNFRGEPFFSRDVSNKVLFPLVLPVSCPFSAPLRVRGVDGRCKPSPDLFLLNPLSNQRPILGVSLVPFNCEFWYCREWIPILPFVNPSRIRDYGSIKPFQPLLALAYLLMISPWFGFHPLTSCK